jgi:hypothetical protein
MTESDCESLPSLVGDDGDDDREGDKEEEKKEQCKQDNPNCRSGRSTRV